MVKYTSRADVVDEDLQNVQEWMKTWGEIRNEIERLGGDVVDAYAVLGDFDFRFTYEAPDEETALQIAVAVERYGLDTTTNQLIPIERMGELAEDI